jgi:hypothetical protein
MSKAKSNVSSVRNNKVLIISVVVVVLVTLVMYFRDQQLQRALDLRRIERRVEVLEEWGLRGRNRQW